MVVVVVVVVVVARVVVRVVVLGVVRGVVRVVPPSARGDNYRNHCVRYKNLKVFGILTNIKSTKNTIERTLKSIVVTIS